MNDPRIRVNIILPQSYLDAIDAERGIVPRSLWIANALRKGKLRSHQLELPKETRGRPKGKTDD